MITVAEVNKAFLDKGLHIELPLPDDRVVKKVEILEKRTWPGGVGVLLNVKFIDEQGREVSDIFFCQGRKESKKVVTVASPIKPLKSEMLPQRERLTFETDEEVKAYLKLAISHLLQDKGYQVAEQSEVDLYLEKGGKGFFINLSCRCDDEAFKRIEELYELRGKYGGDHDYGLVVPAFQEYLGIPLRSQEGWVQRHHEWLSVQHIGVYAADNQDPNKLYSFTVYPQARELRRYFMITSQQWSLVRAKFIERRSERSTL